MSGGSSGAGLPHKTEEEWEHFVLSELLRHDPLDINYGGATDIYGPEARAIALRLSTCRSEGEVCTLIYDQLRSSFGVEAAGSRDDYTALAKSIWTALRDSCPEAVQARKRKADP